MRRCSVHRSFSATPSNRCLFHPCTSLVTYPLQNIPLPMYIKGAPWMCDMTHKHVWHDSFAFFFWLVFIRNEFESRCGPVGQLYGWHRLHCFLKKQCSPAASFQTTSGEDACTIPCHGVRMGGSSIQLFGNLCHFYDTFDTYDRPERTCEV